MSIAETMTPARGSLFAALAKAQAKIKHAVKDSKNPHFNSKYADLAAVAEACREALTENGICVIQDPSTIGNQVTCVTTLGHASGESYESKPLAMVPRDLSPQTVGSCVTYLRRYQLASVVGVAPDDDDGNAAQGLASPKGEAGTAKPAAAPRANTVKHDGKPATNDSIARLMALKADVGGMSPDMYSKQLAAFKQADGKPCQTAADLSQPQIQNLIERYEKKIAQQKARAADVPDITPIIKPTLRELMAKHFEDGEDAEWIFATFGEEHVQALNPEQATDAYALLDAFGDPDRFDTVATRLRALGRIK